MLELAEHFNSGKKINVDNKPASGHLDGYCCRLIGVSICWAEADTQFTIFDLSALKKQCLIFYLFFIFGVYL